MSASWCLINTSGQRTQILNCVQSIAEVICFCTWFSCLIIWDHCSFQREIQPSGNWDAFLIGPILYKSRGKKTWSVRFSLLIEIKRSIGKRVQIRLEKSTDMGVKDGRHAIEIQMREIIWLGDKLENIFFHVAETCMRVRNIFPKYVS